MRHSFVDSIGLPGVFKGVKRGQMKNAGLSEECAHSLVLYTLQ